MAAVISATLTGLRTNRGNPAGPIVASDVSAVAGDLGLCMEVLTNKKGDNSGGAPTTTGHAHGDGDGDGNLIYLPLSTQCFGCKDPDNYRDPATFKNYQTPPRIYEDSATTHDPNVVLFFQPFFVPRGFAGKDLLVILSAWGSAENPRCYATLSTWGTTSPPSSAVYSTETPVTGSDRIQFRNIRYYNAASGIAKSQNQPEDFWCALVTPASEGIHTLKIETSLQPYDSPIDRVFGDLSLIWAIPENQVPAVTGRRLPTKAPAPPTAGQMNVVVGDPDSSSGHDFEPVYSDLVEANDALGPALEMNNRNAAYVEEMARGLPAQGNESLTVADGHYHSVETSNPYGRRVEACLGSWAFGAASSIGDTRSRIQAPMALGTTYVVSTYGAMMTPKYTDAGNTRLYAAVLVRAETGKSLPKVKVSSDPGATHASATTVTMTAPTGTASGYQLVTSATQFNMTSGGMTAFYAELGLQSVVSGNGGLMGMTFFIDE